MNRWHYILNDDHTVTDVPLLTWAKRFEKADRRVKTNWIKDIRVSTVFLWIDHNFSNDWPPLLFETMVFWYEDEMTKRYATRDEAVAWHDRIVEEVMSFLDTLPKE